MNQNEDASGFAWWELLGPSTEVWLRAAREWQDMTARAADLSRSEEYMQAFISMWSAFLFPWGGVGPSVSKKKERPDMIEAFLRVLGPDAMSGEISSLLWGSLPGAGPEAQQKALKAWSDIYEQAVQPLLKAPRVGLTRVFQEKISQLADKFNTYQTTVSEFQLLLSGPMDNSFADMREELDKTGAKEGGGPEDDERAYYEKWIKALEGHYMRLFRSEEYHVALSRLLEETAAFRMSGNDVLTEVLQFLPAPTNKEMDELYKEIYTLKKTIKETTKMVKKMESKLGGQAMAPPVGDMSEGGIQ